MTLFDSPMATAWQAKEVLKEIDDRPHLLVCLQISGGYFPQLGSEPFARFITGTGEVIPSWFAQISDDNRTLCAYFATDMPAQGTIEYGYGSQVVGKVPAKFRSAAVSRLNREDLPDDAVVVSEAFLQAKR